MYTIHQAAKLVGLSPYSLRYYEKEGLISHISLGFPGRARL